MVKRLGCGADQPYRGQTEVIHQCAPQAQDCTRRRYRYRDYIDEVEREKNRIKSTVRSKVEHVFAVMKLQFGLSRYAIEGWPRMPTDYMRPAVNLFLVRRRLLYTAP